MDENKTIAQYIMIDLKFLKVGINITISFTLASRIFGTANNLRIVLICLRGFISSGGY